MVGMLSHVVVSSIGDSLERLMEASDIMRGVKYERLE
jgi:hypothetical protein